jgi:hypothetical protein
MKQKRLPNLQREKSDLDVMNHVIAGFRPEHHPPAARVAEKPRSQEHSASDKRERRRRREKGH